MINTQKSVVFLYTCSKQFGKEMKEAILFTVAFKRIKYLGINLTKEVKDLYTGNCKVLLREIKEDLNKWKDSLCSWAEDLIC